MDNPFITDRITRTFKDMPLEDYINYCNTTIFNDTNLKEAYYNLENAFIKTMQLSVITLKDCENLKNSIINNYIDSKLKLPLAIFILMAENLTNSDDYNSIVLYSNGVCEHVAKINNST